MMSLTPDDDVIVENTIEEGETAVEGARTSDRLGIR